MKKNFLFTIMATAIAGAVIARSATLLATSSPAEAEFSVELEDSVNNNSQLVLPEFPTPEFTDLVADGETVYYLYNVEAKGFVTGANDWGTRTSVFHDHGNAMRFEITEEGIYRLMDMLPNGSWSAFDCDESLSSWVDGEGREGDGLWTVTQNGDKTFTLANLVANESEGRELKWGVDITLEDTRCYFNDGQENYGDTWAVVSEEAYNQFQVDLGNYQNFGRIVYGELPSWTSTNHDHNSEASNEWVLDVKSNSNLSFDWRVSSESGYDYLKVYLNGQQILNESGERSGTFTKQFSDSCSIVLKAVYSKDEIESKGDDEATLSNITLYTDVTGVLNDIAFVEAKLADYEGYDALQEELASVIDDLQKASDVNELVAKYDSLNNLFTVANEIKAQWSQLNDNTMKYGEVATLTQDSTLVAALDVANAVLSQKATYTTSSLQEIQSAADELNVAISSLNIPDGQKVWDFTLSAQTIADLNYDSRNYGWWNNYTSYYRLGSSWSGYQQMRVYSSQGEKFIPETEGLFFNLGGNTWALYADGTNRLYISYTGSSYGFEIPNLKKGQKIAIDYATASSGSSRGIVLNSSNAVLRSGSNLTTSSDVATYEVTADGNVFFYPTGGAIYINSISITVPNSLWRLVDIRGEVAEYMNSLDSFPGLKAELQEAYDVAVLSEGKTVEQICDELNTVLGNVRNAVQLYPEILADLTVADSILSEVAYVDIEEAVELAKSIDVNVTTSETYMAAYDALETALAIYNADQVERADWAFNTNTVYTVNGLRYYLDTTHHLAEFINFSSSNAYSGALNIPATIRYNGTTYAVVAMINNSRYTQSNITKVTLPKSLRYIGDYGLSYLSNVRSIEIPENVTSMGSYVFSNSNNLTAIKMNAVVPPTISSMSGSSYKKITIPAESFHAYRIASVWKDNILIGGDGVTVSTGKIVAGDLGHIVIDEATYLQEVNKLIIDEGTLNNDDWNTIKSMTNLLEIDMSGVTMSSLPANAFDGRWAIEKVVLPHNVSSIGSRALYGTGIKTIEFPESLTSLSTYSFYNCDSLQIVTIPNGVRNVPDYCFYDCDNLKKVEIPEGLTSINQYAFNSCDVLSDVPLPSSLTSIGSYAFRYCPIKTIDIPAGITTINSYSFADNSALDSLFIPETVSTINSNAFYNCSSLKNVQFSEGLVNLYSYAFYNCKQLSEIILPSSLEKCESAPFYGCSGIKKVEARSVIPPSTNGSCPLSNVNLDDVVLYVPSWSTSEYTLADGWSLFYTVEVSDFMPQYIKVNKDFYFTLRDTLAADYRPNIKMTFSDVQSTDAYGHTNYERGNLTISGRSKLAVNNLDLEYSSYAKYFADENLTYGYDYDNYRTSINSTSLIVNGEMRAEDVTIWLNTYNNRWQFISFPFDVNVSDITPGSASTSWVIRKHNGKARAAAKMDAVWENMKTMKVESDLAQPKFSPLAADGNTVQYLYNVETGTFVIGANEWNTRASVSPDGGYQFKVKDNGDGTFTLNDYVETKGVWSAVFADNGEGIWVDNLRGANVNGWVITENGDSTYTITNPGAREGHNLGVSADLADNRLYLDSDSNNGTTWAFINANDYMEYLKSMSGEVVVDTLYAGQGYIMHTYNPTNTNSWFAVSPIKNSVNRQLIFSSEDRTIELEENLAEFDHNRSWNLIGNPYPCFYDTRFMDFDAPFMVWNSYTQSYVAYNPADDAYILSPGEAFFVQRPFDHESITFRKEGRQTHRYAREMELEAPARAKAASNNVRTIYNLTLKQDTLVDRTRVVFNEAASLKYDMSKDAAKFTSTDRNVPQIFTIADKTRYAINERPFANGDVALGVYCGTEGEFTISLDKTYGCKVILEDKLNNGFVELSADNSYTFSAFAGEYLNRFVLHFENDATGVNNINVDDINADDAIYNLQGIKVNSTNNKGIYIKNGQKTIIK